MNILDTFFFMFEADASKVEKGTKAGDDAAKKLKTSIDAADVAASKLGDNFLRMAKAATGAIGAIAGLGVLKALVNDTVAQTAALAIQARALDMNVQSLSAYQNAVVSMGGDAAQAVGTIEKLRDKFVEMSKFGVMVGPDAFMFRQLGLDAKTMHAAIKDPTVALSKLAGTFEKLNHTQQLYIGKKLGFDQGTIALLAQGQQAFDDLIKREKELHAVTEQQADAALKFKIAQSELGISFETVKRGIVTEMLPALTWIVNGLSRVTDWIAAHKAATLGFFAGLAAVIGVGAIAAWGLVAPFAAVILPIVAIGTAIGLVIDDIEKFRAGQKSLIGSILAKWPMIGEVVRAIAQIVKMSFDLIVNSFKWFGGVVKSDGIDLWEGYKKSVQVMIDTLVKAFPVLGDVFKAVAEGIKFEIDGVTIVFKGLVNLIKEAWALIKHAPVAVLNWIGKHLAGATGEHYDAVGEGAPQASTLAADVAMPQAAVKLGGTAGGKQIASKLVAMGWSPEQAAGIAGSFMQESTGRADARNPTSGAYGLGQWLGSRVKDFKAWSGHDLEGSSLDDQLGFFNYEVTKGKERHAGDMIRAAKTAAEAADAHSKYYERPGSAEANLTRREAFANTIYAGQSAVANTSHPLAAMSSQSIKAASGGNSSTTVQIASLSIHTQATDAKGIAQAVSSHLKTAVKNALDYHDDGIAI